MQPFTTLLAKMMWWITLMLDWPDRETRRINVPACRDLPSLHTPIALIYPHAVRVVLTISGRYRKLHIEATQRYCLLGS